MPRSEPGPSIALWSNRAVPAVARSWPTRMRNSVDLPQPLGPTTEQNVPALTARSMFSSTSLSPYHLYRSSTCSMRSTSGMLMVPSCSAVRRSPQAGASARRSRLFLRQVPAEAAPQPQAQQRIEREPEERDPGHVGQDHVHCQVTPDQEDPIAEALGRCNRLGGDQEQPR